MTITTGADACLSGPDDSGPSLGEQLLKQVTNPRDRAALRALVEEETILARDSVRQALIVTDDAGVPVGCAWDRLARSRFGLNLEEQRIFLDFVLSVAGPHHVNLGWIMELDDRRLAILLRAMTEMAGNNTIAIATRI